MKKTIIVIGLLCLLFVLCSCSISKEFPSDGIYYCEELNLSIDTSKVQENSLCAQLYTDTDSYIDCRCLIDYGNGITVTSEDQETVYLCGKYHYQKGDRLVIIESPSGIEYTFERQKDI